MKKYNFKFYKALVFILLISCTHKPIESNRLPSSNNETKIKFIDPLNTKYMEKAVFIKFKLPENMAVFENHIRLLKKTSDEIMADLIKLGFAERKIETLEQSIQFDPTDKEYRKGLDLLLTKISNYNEAPTDKIKSDLIYQIALIANAMSNNYIAPIKVNFEVLKAPIYILQYTYHQTINKQERKNSNVDPEDSYLWHNTDLSKPKNLFSYRFKTIDGEECEYDKPKAGFGVHAGFHIKCDKENYKLKFGNEVYAGPLNSRIYKLFGYEAPQINYVEGARIKYNRKIFTEFNQRKVETFSATLFGGKVSTLANNKKYLDAFKEISHFVLIDGATVDSMEFKKRLIINEIPNNPKIINSMVRDYSNSDFNQDEEKKIKLVVFKPATITTKTKDSEIGPWKYDDLDFEDRREFKGIYILSGWLGNFDIRMDNNRLLLQKEDKDSVEKENKIRLALVDVGSGLGRSNSVFSKSSSEINEMPWDLTETFQDTNDNNGHPSGTTERLQMVGFSTLELSDTFSGIYLSDAQWMLRKICQVTNQQLTEALVSTGMSSASVKLAFAKLINRRNKMITDFEMTKELKDSCYTPIDKKMNYDPVIDGPVVIKTESGESIIAPDRNDVVNKGVLEKRK